MQLSLHSVTEHVMKPGIWKVFTTRRGPMRWLFDRFQEKKWVTIFQFRGGSFWTRTSKIIPWFIFVQIIIMGQFICQEKLEWPVKEPKPFRDSTFRHLWSTLISKTVDFDEISDDFSKRINSRIVLLFQIIYYLFWLRAHYWGQRRQPSWS